MLQMVESEQYFNSFNYLNRTAQNIHHFSLKMYNYCMKMLKNDLI